MAHSNAGDVRSRGEAKRELGGLAPKYTQKPVRSSPPPHTSIGRCVEGKKLPDGMAIQSR
jgi:hypothetical protein